MEEKLKLINELYEKVDEILKMYGLSAKMKTYKDVIDIYDTKERNIVG